MNQFISSRAHFSFMGFMVGGIGLGQLFIFLNLNVGIGAIVGAVVGGILGYKYGLREERKPIEPKNLYEGQEFGEGSTIEIIGTVRVDKRGRKRVEVENWKDVKVVKKKGTVIK